jgi:ATP-dependent RNA helicase DeaD
MSQTFETLGLRPELMQAVNELGYEQPTPIQVSAIPALLNGRDVFGQAQTGTGKTAAFALPMLQCLDPETPGVQGLVMTPTRELAIQVSEAMYRYGKYRHLRVLPVYGGQSYARQIKRLDGSTHVVVGTPGRLLDLIQKGVLDLSGVRYLVLDEADEMLKMGFIEDVETIMSETPTERQTALFSATLADPIRRLAKKYMHDPVTITIERETLTVPEIEQRHYLLDEESKIPALSRLLEVEDIKSALIFTRTKVGAAELAETLLSRGYPAEALHGDLSQDVRETVLRRFRRGQLIYLVATDVVARGVDIQDVSHVINYDMPNDAEDYVHRIGRTGRAGRAGVAISFVTPRERRWLRAIEAFTRQRIARAKLPPREEVLAKRDERFINSLESMMNDNDLSHDVLLVEQMAAAGMDVHQMAAAAIRMARSMEGNRPLEDVVELADRPERERRDRRFEDRSDRPRRDNGSSAPRGNRRASRESHEPGMVRLSMNVGKIHGVQPGEIVGAIAGMAGIPGRAIGAISIHQNETFVDVEEAHAERVLKQMRKGKLRGMNITMARANN